MTNSSHIAKIGLLIFGVLFLASSSAQNRPPIVEKVAKIFGLDSFGQVDAIRYTFNVDFPGRKFSRTWVWEPKADRVTYEGKDKAGNPVKVTYVRSQLSSQPDNVKNEIDPAFANDNYWLLFPLHAYWDTSADVQDKGKQKLPLGRGSADQVVVKYPSEGGYTPGDTWELFVGPDDRVQEMVFRHGGNQKSSPLMVSWADYKKAGPLLFSLDHRGTRDGKPARVFFSDVAVKLVGSDKWVNAQ